MNPNVEHTDSRRYIDITAAEEWSGIVERWCFMWRMNILLSIPNRTRSSHEILRSVRHGIVFDKSDHWQTLVPYRQPRRDAPNLTCRTIVVVAVAAIKPLTDMKTINVVSSREEELMNLWWSTYCTIIFAVLTLQQIVSPFPHNWRSLKSLLREDGNGKITLSNKSTSNYMTGR